jgi:hypothetical protein
MKNVPELVKSGKKCRYYRHDMVTGKEHTAAYLIFKNANKLYMNKEHDAVG